jgi:hypothetical protein
MIFQDGHSSLVRLSDCLKMGVGNALETAKQIISMHRKRADSLKEIRRIAELLDCQTWRDLESWRVETEPGVGLQWPKPLPGSLRGTSAVEPQPSQIQQRDAKH